MSIYEIFGTIVREIDLQDKQHMSLESTTSPSSNPVQPVVDSAMRLSGHGELDYTQLTQLLDQALAAGPNQPLVMSILGVLERSLAAHSGNQEDLEVQNINCDIPGDLMQKKGIYLDAWRIVDEARQYSWLYGITSDGPVKTGMAVGRWRALDALTSAVCKCHEQLVGEQYLSVAQILRNLLVHAAHEMHSVTIVRALQTVKEIATLDGAAGVEARCALAEVVAKMCAIADSGSTRGQDRVCLVYCLFHGWAITQAVAVAPAVKRRDAGLLRKSSNDTPTHANGAVGVRSTVAGQVLALDLLDLLLRSIGDSTRVYPPFCMLHCSAVPGIIRRCGASTEPQVFDKALVLLISLLQRPWDPLKDTLGALFKEVYLVPLQSTWAHTKMYEAANSQSHQIVAMQISASVQQILLMRGLLRVCEDPRSLAGLVSKSKEVPDPNCTFQELFNVLCRIVRVVFETPPVSTPPTTGRLHGVWSTLRGSSNTSEAAAAAAAHSGENEQRRIQYLRMAVLALKCLVAMVGSLGAAQGEQTDDSKQPEEVTISMHSLKIPESIDDAVNMFNDNPEAGLQTILQLGLIPSDCPDTVMQYLVAGISGDRTVGKLATSKARISRTAMCQLAFGDESCEYLAQAFDQMELHMQPLASALASLFEIFLPIGVQQLDTLLLAFARQFCQRNRAYLNSLSEPELPEGSGQKSKIDGLSAPKKEDASAKQVVSIYVLACLALVADCEVWQRQTKMKPDELLKHYMPSAAKDTVLRTAFGEIFGEIQARPIVHGSTSVETHPGWMLSPERQTHPISELNKSMFTSIWPALHPLLVRAFERTNVRLWDDQGSDLAGNSSLVTESRLQKSLLQQVLSVMRQCLRVAGQSRQEAIVQQAVGGLARMAGLDRAIAEWKHGEAARAIMQVAVEERAALTPVWDQLAELLASVGARLESHIVFDGEKPSEFADAVTGSPDSDRTLHSPVGDSCSFTTSMDTSQLAVHTLVPPTHTEIATVHECKPVGMPLARLLGYMDALARVVSIEAQQQTGASDTGSIKSELLAMRAKTSQGSISTVGSGRSTDSMGRTTRNLRKMFTVLEALAEERSAFEWLAVWDHISQYIVGLACSGRSTTSARALTVSLVFDLAASLAKLPKSSVLELQNRVLKAMVRITKANKDLAAVQHVAGELDTLVGKCLVHLGSGWSAVFDMVARLARRCARASSGLQVREIANMLLHTVDQSLDAPPSVKFGRLPALRALVAIAVCAQPGVGVTGDEDSGLAESVMNTWVRLSGKMIDQISSGSLSLSIASIWGEERPDEGGHCELPPEIQSIIAALAHLLAYEPAAILRNVQSPPQVVQTLGNTVIVVQPPGDDIGDLCVQSSDSIVENRGGSGTQSKSSNSVELSSNNGTCGSSHGPESERVNEFEHLRIKLIDVVFVNIHRALPLLGRHAYRTLLHNGFLCFNSSLFTAKPACMACWSYVLSKWLDLLIDCMKTAHLSLSVRQDSFSAFLDLAGVYAMSPLEPLAAEALRSIAAAVRRYASECQSDLMVPGWVWDTVVAKLQHLISESCIDETEIGQGLTVAAEREAAKRCALHARILKLVYLLGEEHPNSGQAWVWLTMLEDSHVHASNVVRHEDMRRLVKEGDMGVLAPAYMRLELVAHAARISVAFRVLRAHVADAGTHPVGSPGGGGYERLGQLAEDLVGMSADIVESYFLTLPASGPSTDIGLISIAHTVAATLELWADVYISGGQGQRDSGIGVQLASSVDALVLKVCDVLEVTEQPFVRKAAAKFMRSALCYLST